MKLLLPCAVLVVGLSLPTALPLPAQAASPAQPYDFDGNGHPELVSLAPGLSVDGVADAGGVVVLPASARGVASRGTILTGVSPGLSDPPKFGEGWEMAVASADFDRDGYADLAVGQGNKSLGSRWSAGRVMIIPGSVKGLDAHRATALTEPGGQVDNAQFGGALAAGDLDDDGYPDLVVGAPGESYTSDPRGEYDARGTVLVMHGGPSGLRAGVTIWGQREGIGASGFDLHFGALLALADLDLDGRLDLVVGSPGVPYTLDDGFPGSISTCLSGRGGPVRCDAVVRSKSYATMSSLAVGNMSGSPVPEIAAGVPDSHLYAYGRGGGSVRLVQLTPAGTTTARETTLTQASPGVAGGDKATAELRDDFGSSVALGDLDRDGYDDLVVGSPGENGARGRVTVVHGAEAGWRTDGRTSTFDQQTRGVPGVGEDGDRFGQNLALRDHDGDGRLDLVVAATGEDDGSGALTILPGSRQAFGVRGSSTVNLASLGYPEPKGARLGAVLGR